MANYLWNDSEGKNKFHLGNWDSVSMCRDFVGFGIPNLRDLNICLIDSWLRRYAKDKDKLWKDLVDYKYHTTNPNIFLINSAGSSNFFKGFMWAVQVARMGYKWHVGNGHKVRFWEDVWLGSSSLAIQFWKLYRIVNEKGFTVAELWDGNQLKCTFRRTVDNRLLDM